MSISLRGHTIDDIVTRLKSGQCWKEGKGFVQSVSIVHSVRDFFYSLGLCESMVQVCAQHTFNQLMRADVAQGTFLGDSLDGVDLFAKTAKLEASALKARQCFIAFLGKNGFGFIPSRPVASGAPAPVDPSILAPAPHAAVPPSASASEGAFAQLPRPDESQLRALTNLLTCLTTTPETTLAKWEASRLFGGNSHVRQIDQWKAVIKQVHPFASFAHIFENSDLRKQILALEAKRLVMMKFAQDFSADFEAQWKRGALGPYLNGFARKTGLDEEQLRSLVVKRNWDGLLEMFKQAMRARVDAGEGAAASAA